jgi:hypothetical protein
MKQESTTDHLDEVRRDLERWRQRRSFGTRIPEELWQAAAEVGREVGVSKTARELGLDYYKLRRRTESAAETLPAKETPQEGRFLEIPMCAPASPECVLEIEDGQGARLRLELKGATPAHLETVARTFWSLAR